MSISAIRYALSVPKLSPSERLLFILLADMEKDGACFPSQTYLAKRTGLSVRTIGSALSALEGMGHLERTKRVSGAGRTSDLMTLRLPSKPANFAGTPLQNVPTNPYSPYGVVEKKGRKAPARKKNSRRKVPILTLVEGGR